MYYHELGSWDFSLFWVVDADVDTVIGNIRSSRMRLLLLGILSRICIMRLLTASMRLLNAITIRYPHIK
jgi:hypothetical protein